ncbi:MAG: HD domain-containing protein [Acetatifactor sp.]|nr:HD domain-containing protein [Acetatifactor sp.]
MLDKYTYINHLCSDSDIAQKIKSLFLLNDQQKRYEHICSVAKRIDSIAIQYGLDREKCRLSAMLHDISTLIK